MTLCDACGHPRRHHRHLLLRLLSLNLLRACKGLHLGKPVGTGQQPVLPCECPGWEPPS